MTRKNIVAEIGNSLKQYDEAGLLDYFSINSWIRNALLEFGGNIMEATEKTLKVENGKAKLPENYYSLALALKCDLHGYHPSTKKKTKHLQSTNFYVERLNTPLYWDNHLGNVPCLEGDECNMVVEEVYFLDRTGNKNYAEAYYDNLIPLRLKSGYKKVKCEPGCPNLNFYESPYEISIHGTEIHTNFEEGNIYIRYRGLPIDDQGDLLIPETQRNKLQEYIKYTCIRRTLENLLLNSDDPNIGQKYQLFKQLENDSYAAAKNDSINEGMRGWKNAIRNKNRRENLKIERLYSNL